MSRSTTDSPSQYEFVYKGHNLNVGQMCHNDLFLTYYRLKFVFLESPIEILEDKGILWQNLAL